MPHQAGGASVEPHQVERLPLVVRMVEFPELSRSIAAGAAVEPLSLARELVVIEPQSVASGGPR